MIIATPCILSDLSISAKVYDSYAKEICNFFCPITKMEDTIRTIINVHKSKINLNTRHLTDNLEKSYLYNN